MNEDIVVGILVAFLALVVVLSLAFHMRSLHSEIVRYETARAAGFLSCPQCLHDLRGVHLCGTSRPVRSVTMAGPNDCVRCPECGETYKVCELPSRWGDVPDGAS